MSRVALSLLIATSLIPAADAIAGGTTLVVDTTSDALLTTCTAAAGDCSLRGALFLMQNVVTPRTIAFDIPMSDPNCVAATGVCTIQPTSSLPQINPAADGLVTIDGYTQPGAVANALTPVQGGSNAQLKIVVNGGNCSDCNAFSFGNNGTVRGLVINGFAGNSSYAVSFSVQGFGSGGVLEGCFLGTDVTGTLAVPNRFGIVLPGNPFGGLSSSNVRIGGTLPAQRNLISGNLNEGINLAGPGHTVLGNLIGSNAAGTAALGNNVGIRLSGGAGFAQFVGDGTEAGRNVISGNATEGIIIAGAGPTQGHRVRGNFIGTDVTGTLALGNGRTGILLDQSVSGAQPPLVGGVAAGDANTIAFNASHGVQTGNSRGHVAGNRMFRNGHLGIGNSTTARRVNDAGDPDSVTNLGQNFAEISAYAINAGNVELSYRVDSSTGNATYPLRVEFFKADGDEGRDFLGADEYTQAEAQTVKAISRPIPGSVALGANDIVVATATDAQGNTSEFSFHAATVGILADGPDPSASGTTYQVDVEVLATTGPFRPNGVVSIGDGRGGSCEASLAPAAQPLRAIGSCLLNTGGAAGAVTLTATYDTFRHAFAAANGSSAQTTASHTLSDPPPEQVTFERCVQSVNENDGVASVRVNRQGGAQAVSVGFEHLSGSATAGGDYTAPTAGVLSWNLGDTTPRFIDVPLVDDAAGEPVETFRLQLLDPLGTSITPIGLVELRIHDGEGGHLFGDGFEGQGCP